MLLRAIRFFISSIVATLILVTGKGYAFDTTLPKEVLDNGFEDIKIALFEPDIELQRMLASGRLEARADWTEAGVRHTREWVENFFTESGYEFTEFKIAPDQSGDRFRQLMGLHEAVGYSILSNKRLPLPTKKGKFEWTIGPGAAEIAKATGADYGMFIFYRRGYTTAGRVATVLGAALLGVGVVGAYQLGFATLVDLKTGEFVWFHDIALSPGDMREKEDAQYTLATLLEGIPGLVLPEVPDSSHAVGTAN